MGGLSASRTEPMLKASGAKMVPTLCGCMKRLHLGGAAIEAANMADEGAREEGRHIDALKLVVELTDGAVNVQEEGLHAGGRAGNRDFQSYKLLPK
ncbi:MAG: hypothetical protein ABS70_05940 [Nitrospira sp. SCN 59-13]|nr:MAG: hypothetical protein ABS70_05940 [Nitrospira sp. SCN 59-13]